MKKSLIMNCSTQLHLRDLTPSRRPTMVYHYIHLLRRNSLSQCFTMVLFHPNSLLLRQVSVLNAYVPFKEIITTLEKSPRAVELAVLERSALTSLEVGIRMRMLWLSRHSKLHSCFLSTYMLRTAGVIVELGYQHWHQQQNFRTT